MKTVFLFLLTFSWALLVSAEESLLHSAEPVIRVLMLRKPQAEFAGFYMAQADGIYRKAGLNILLSHPSPGEDPFDSLRDGKADIVVGWPLAAVERAAKGEDVINIGQLAGRSSLIMIARKKSGINRPEEMSGHRIGLWPAGSLQATQRAFLRHCGVKNYTELPVLSNVDLFLYGGVDVTVGCSYDEYYQLFAAGIDADELKVFQLNDVFPWLMDDGLYCKRQFYEENPKRCRRFLDATLKGWERVSDSEERTLALIRRECQAANLPYSPGRQKFMLHEMKQLIFPHNALHDGHFNETLFREALKLQNSPNATLNYEFFAPLSAGAAQ